MHRTQHGGVWSRIGEVPLYGSQCENRLARLQRCEKRCVPRMSQALQVPRDRLGKAAAHAWMDAVTLLGA